MLEWNISVSERTPVSTRLLMCELDKTVFSEYGYTQWAIYIYDFEGEYFELAAVPVTEDGMSEYDVPYMLREYDPGEKLEDVLPEYNKWVSLAIQGKLEV